MRRADSLEKTLMLRKIESKRRGWQRMRCLDNITYSVQFSSVAQSCPTLCDPMNCSMPGFPVLLHLLELIQIHVHWVTDAIQLSYLLSLPFSAFSLSQQQGFFPMSWLFTLGGHSIGNSASASVLPMNISGLISFKIDWFGLLAGQGTLRSLL